MLAKGYARTYRTTAVLTASPGQLVLMLYDGALRSLAIARDAFDRTESDARRLETINNQLLKTQAIITELQSGLNFEKGGEMATSLDRLYEYYKRRLFEANLRKQEAPVAEVEKLIGELRAGWAEMLTKQDSGPAPEAVRSVA